MPFDPSRRQFLAGAVAAGAAAALKPVAALAAGPAAPAALSAGAFRFVHLTDVHVMLEKSADRGFAKALRAVESLKPRPDFILTGGDLVFDVLGATPARARDLFTLYKKVLADNTSLPVHNTLGNHDVFGWLNRDGLSPQTPGYGKALASEFLGLKRTFDRFDHKGWRFIRLDNIQPGGPRGYQGFLDGPQFDWLKSELVAAPPAMPVVICEHIPLLTVTAFMFSESYKNGSWELENSLVCGDAAQRTQLIRDRNVRLSLSGHIHALDRVDFRGTTYICDGAVCANWWKGPRDGMPEGFGIFDLRADGTFTHQYFNYGWTAVP